MKDFVRPQAKYLEKRKPTPQELRQALRQALEVGSFPGPNPEEAEEGGLVASMHSIQMYLDASYRMGVNPLEGLRAILPDATYEWKWALWTPDLSPVIIGHRVDSADFIWRVDGYMDEEVEIVTAERRGGRSTLPKQWFWLDNSPRTANYARTFAEAFDLNPVYWPNVVPAVGAAIDASGAE